MERQTQPMVDLQAYLTPNQIKRMIEAAHKRTDTPRRNRDILLLTWLAYSGRRIGEILKVKVKDIIMEDAQVNYHILKKKVPTRKIKSLNYNLFQMVVQYIYENSLEQEDYIFKSSWFDNRPITDARVRQIVYKYSELANIPDFAPGKHPHPHTFRHSFAVANAKRMKTPADLRKLQQTLEHSKIDITTFYLQFSDKDQRTIVEDVYETEPDNE